MSTRVHSGVLAALTLVGSHYGGVDYDAMGQGYLSKKFDDELLAISNSATCAAEVLASKVPDAMVRL